MFNIGCYIIGLVIVFCWGGCSWGGGWEIDGVEVGILFLVLTLGEEFWEVLVGVVVVVIVLVLIGFCFFDVCLSCRFCILLLFGFL